MCKFAICFFFLFFIIIIITLFILCNFYFFSVCVLLAIKKKKKKNFVQLSIYLKVLTDKHIAINLVKWSIKKKPKYLPVAAIYTRKMSVS